MMRMAPYEERPKMMTRRTVLRGVAAGALAPTWWRWSRVLGVPRVLGDAELAQPPRPTIGRDIAVASGPAVPM